MNDNTEQNKPLPIVDSYEPSNTLINSVRDYFTDGMPLAWGRYFTTSYPAEYNHALENKILHDNGIKLIPIARRTCNVGGDFQLGANDARAGVEDLIATFGLEFLISQGPELLYFLDVEGDPTGPNGSISQPYYGGWSTTLVSYSQSVSDNSLTILPCVYANHGDLRTFKILTQNNLKCHGLWIARYYNSPTKSPAWDENFAVPGIVQQSDIPVFMRQFAGGQEIGQGFDLDQTNPNIPDINAAFFDRLILPPG